MKNIIISALFSVLIVMIVKCDINMDSQYALSKCPKNSYGSSMGYSNQICTKYGCEFGSRKDGCVEYELGKCYPCEPNDDTVGKVATTNEIMLSTDSKDVVLNPLYFSEMNSLESLTTEAYFGKEQASSFYTGSCESETFSSGYLNRYYHISVSGNNYASQSGSRIIKPAGDKSINLSNGTVSFWMNLRTIGSVNNMSSQAACRVFSFDRSVIQIYFSSIDASDIVCYLYINNKEIISKKVSYNNGWFHAYIIWGDGIQNNKTMRIFIDKKEIISYSEPLPDMSSFNFSTSLDGYVLAHGDRKCKKILGVWKECKNITGGTNSSVYIDKLKLWDNIVSEDPEAEYNK